MQKKLFFFTCFLRHTLYTRGLFQWIKVASRFYKCVYHLRSLLINCFYIICNIYIYIWYIKINSPFSVVYFVYIIQNVKFIRDSKIFYLWLKSFIWIHWHNFYFIKILYIIYLWYTYIVQKIYNNLYIKHCDKILNKHKI